MSSTRPPTQRKSGTAPGSSKPKGTGDKKDLDKTPDKINAMLCADSISAEQAIKIKDAIKVASKSWLLQFLKTDGLQNLAGMLLKYQGLEDKEPIELRIQYELLLSIKAAMNSQTGLDMMIDEPDLIASLALNIDSEDSAICTQTLELLAVLMVSGDNGARAVLESLDFFKLVTRERVRFQCLVDALHSNGTSFAFKRDIILFLNTVVNTATELEDRLEIRADMIYSGIIPTVEKLKQLCFDELGKDFEDDYDNEATERMEEIQELESQLQVFETVMQRDIAECVTDMETTFQSAEVDLSDPEQIFQSLHASSVEHECFLPFLSVLQTLLMIPSYDSFGKMQWEAVDAALKNFVASEAIATNEDYSPEYLISSAKYNLSWKQRLEELSQEVDQLSSRCQEMEETETILKNELEELRRQDAAVASLRDKERKASELLSRQVRHMQELREFEKGIVSRAEEILMSGQDVGGGRRLSKGAARNSSRQFLLANSPSASKVGPVAMPVMRAQGSRNILHIDDNDDEEDDYEDNGNAGDEDKGGSSSDAATPGAISSPSPHLPGRGFGRAAPITKLHCAAIESKREESAMQPEIRDKNAISDSIARVSGSGGLTQLHVEGETAPAPVDTGAPETDGTTLESPNSKAATGKFKRNDSARILSSDDEGESSDKFEMDPQNDVIAVSAEHVGALERAARESEQRADSREVESMQLKRQLFELEVRLNESQRELQRQVELSFEKENEFKRKLKHAEMSGEDPRETILSLLQKSAVGRHSVTDADAATRSALGQKNSSGSSAGGVGKLGAGGGAHLSALFGAGPATLLSSPTASFTASGGGEGVASDSRTGQSANPMLPHGGTNSLAVGSSDRGMLPAVKQLRPPPCPPQLPPEAMYLLASIEAAKPGGIPLAPPLPGDAVGGGPGERRDENAKPKKAVITPKVAMRSLFWNKIPDRMVSKTVWEELNDEEVKLDIQKLESQFCKAVIKTQGDDDKKESTVDKVEKPKEVTLLDTKVQQNVGIALVKYRMSSHEIRKAIIRMDDKKLDLEKLNSLRSLAPTPDDIATLRDFEGDVETLGRVEKFFIQIIDIPRYTQRLDCFIFMRKFQMLMSEVYCELDVLNRAIDQVENAASFRKILEITLAVGNYLNGGTPRGGVYGFKLDGLLKLPTVKSVDNKLTLMDFITTHCEETDAGVAIIDNELSITEEASRIGLDTCRGEINALKKNLSNVDEQIKAQEAEQYVDPSDQFVAKLLPFWKEAVIEVDKLEAEFSATAQRFSQMADFFGEDGKRSTTEEFFGLLKAFVTSFMKAHRDNEKRRIMQEKSEMKRMAEEKKKKLRAERKAAATGDVETLVDDVFGNLKGKKADEIVDSLKVSSLHSSTSRRKGTGSKRIGGGAGGKRRQKHAGAAVHEGEEDDALAAMMSKLGMDSGSRSMGKKKSSKVIDPDASVAEKTISSDDALALASAMISDSMVKTPRPSAVVTSGTLKSSPVTKASSGEDVSPTSAPSVRRLPTTYHSEVSIKATSPVAAANRKTPSSKAGRTPRVKPAEEEDDLAAFFKRKKEGADSKGPNSRAVSHGKLKF